MGVPSAGKMGRSIISISPVFYYRLPAIRRPGYWWYWLFKFTLGFPMLWRLKRGPISQQLASSGIAVINNTRGLPTFWKKFDKYMETSPLSPPVYCKGHITQLNFFNGWKSAEMGKLSEEDITEIVDSLDCMLRAAEEYFRSPISICNIRSWRTLQGSEIKRHIDAQPHGYIKIMMYRDCVNVSSGALHVEKKNGEIVKVVGSNPVVIFDSLHLFHFTKEVCQPSRDCIEVTVIADRRRRVVQAGNHADCALNPFSDWDAPSSGLKRLNKEYYISE